MSGFSAFTGKSPLTSPLKAAQPELGRVNCSDWFLLRLERFKSKMRWGGSSTGEIIHTSTLTTSHRLAHVVLAVLEPSLRTISSPGSQYPSCSMPALEPLQPTVSVSTTRPSFTARLSCRAVSLGCMPNTRLRYLHRWREAAAEAVRSVYHVILRLILHKTNRVH